MKFKNLMKVLVFSFILILSTSNVSAEVQYESMNVPTNVSTYFKTWMDYRCIGVSTPQRNLLRRDYVYIDCWGFFRAFGEEDLGITDDYYVIALGSYYGTQLGSKYRITTDTGRVFYGILGDCKSDRHTNSTHQYTIRNNDVIEFIVDKNTLHPDVKRMGSANVFMPLNGNIAKIERINFIY